MGKYFNFAMHLLVEMSKQQAKINRNSTGHSPYKSNNSSNNKSSSEYKPRMKKCPNCGKKIADFALVCKYCKANLKPKPKPTTKKKMKCPHCGKEIIENAFKCKYCKRKLK